MGLGAALDNYIDKLCRLRTTNESEFRTVSFSLTSTTRAMPMAGCKNYYFVALEMLTENYNHYFPEMENPHKGYFWINNPFLDDVNSHTRDLHDKEKK
ncbi:hypothetical protein NPIL_508921 [Nephila pilipes]|uniref:Uncharacterized protein n=1 Tax=Nephila pilipes TaxID=299642 RepID=A0A8X6NR84_NEPPI|nr:hypothetical protein NPIL_508921 [Nephila pilipes]